ncbi:piRNA biogenesis protein EXD1 [Leuresthes tenuis]|uniref:piRNA biogenesis protein EXD1 n=1 Tax=Leuresthes tenuis TaxID=355514 RepID=UPI003B503B8F
MFFGHEILNVELINEASGDRGNLNGDGLEEQLNVEKFQPYRKTITLHDDDYNDEEEESINFVVIDGFHEKFGPAVMHIKKQHVIGVGAEGVEIFKNGRLCWLQIATKNKVYLFDVLLLGARAFKNGLSMILESKRILKVIHDCRVISGSLIAQFGVKLTNVFDTQVADAMCFYSETGGFLPDRVSTLQEVVNLHLKVPSSRLSSLQMKSQLTKEEREMWYKRPCSVPLLKVMVLSVIHLQPLRLVLLDSLMNDYMTLVDSYLNSTHYQPDELEHVSMEGVLELPRELRQLDEMRRERQELATNHYPVTEEGLLARFDPHPQSSSQTASVPEDQSKTPPDCFGPATVELPSSPQMDPLVHQNARCPSSVTTVSSGDVHASFNPPAHCTTPATVLHHKKEMFGNSTLSAGADRGCKESQMDMMGRGRLFGKEPSSSQVLPSIGRGFLLHIPPPQISREHSKDIKAPVRLEMAPPTSHTLTQEPKPQPGCHDDELSKDICGVRGECFTPSSQSLSSQLSNSFRSFRY